MHDVPQRRLATRLRGHPNTLIQSLEPASLVRSLIGSFRMTLSHDFRLLRVSMCDTYLEEESIESHDESLLGLVNLRFILVDVGMGLLPKIPSSVSLLWNLQTIIISHTCRDFIFAIWKMPQLRHVLSFGGGIDGAYCFPDHGDLDVDDDLLLENLHTLLVVSNLNISEEVVKIIPNIIMLDLFYDEDKGDYCLNNLSRLQKLEILSLEYVWNFQHHKLAHLVTFPYSLKELTLKETRLHWEDMQTKIGLLPHLQILHLDIHSCIGSEWKTFEGHFSSLRFLVIDDCTDLKYWMTDNTHFPRLEELDLRCLIMLSEIPLSIGDIPTLRSIKLDCCSESAVDSARRIKEEQEALGNEELQIRLPRLFDKEDDGEYEYDEHDDEYDE